MTWEIWFDPDCAPVLIPSSDGEREQVRKILEAIREEPGADRSGEGGREVEVSGCGS